LFGLQVFIVSRDWFEEYDLQKFYLKVKSVEVSDHLAQLINFNGSLLKNEVKKSNKWNFVGAHIKLCSLERALLVVKKRYGIRRNKIFILTFLYYHYWWCYFFQFLLESKKKRNLGI
jgi:hypothetical protein